MKWFLPKGSIITVVTGSITALFFIYLVFAADVDVPGKFFLVLGVMLLVHEAKKNFCLWRKKKRKDGVLP